MADQTNIIPLNPNTFSKEVYSPSDESLITSLNEDNAYDLNTDYVEFFVYSLNNTIVSPIGNDGTFSNYKVIDNELYIDPETDTARGGITTGTVNTVYNFLRKRLASSPQSTYFISEISSNRTEIRLASNLIPTAEIIASTNEFISYREADETFPDFYINLGSNRLYIANNIMLDSDNTVLIKLYEPLPVEISTKTSLWVVEKISNGLAYRVEFPTIVEYPTIQQLSLKGPNFNLPNKGELNNSTEDVDLTSFSSSISQSQYQINSYFDDPSVSINVDYTDFSNFVFFSSAQSRIENFWYKVSLIESSSALLNDISNATAGTYNGISTTSLNNIINETITNFDRYEYYLYFESSSDTYPKASSTPPYENLSTGSATAITWYENKLTEAENYDNLNQDWLYYAIPEYVRSDSNNDQYMTFVNMVGQFTDDNIWAYLRDTTNKWDADNRINAGVSKDLVAQVLRDMGVKLYQNNFSSTDLYSAFLGFTDSGSLFPFPYMTGSVESAPGILDTPDGYEYITNFISSSDEAIPLDDINKRIYKRIYHNLPYLLKSKGTVAGLRTLITSYGIPDTILRISEFGGKDKINSNDWDLWKHQYNYAYNTNEDGEISSEWNLNSDWSQPTPQTVQFRFKAPKSGSNAVDNAVNTPQQVLWSLNSSPEIAIGLDYFGDGFASGSWSGSIPSESFEYANLVFTTDAFNTTSSVYLPFFDGEWWSVMLTKETDIFTLYAGNKIYNGNDGSQIGFIASASDNFVGNDWDNASNSYFPSNTRGNIGPYQPFSGSYQEIRYFDQNLSQSIFKDYVMNPQSTEGNGVNGSYNQLTFRATLGGELYTGPVSSHPKVSGSYITQSFASDSNFTITNGEFVTNREWVFYDSPPVGIKNRNTDKIKRQDLVLPSGDTLSNQRSIQQKSFTTDNYTNNLNLLEVAFSPQNQINDDIIGQIGYFNIGDYIGDPRLVSSSDNTYPSLVELSQQYFDKYSSNYDVYDYIRLIKFFDNSLFKMIKDYVPSRTGLASGIVVKQHILERQKYPTPQAEWTRPEYTGSIGSTPMVDNEGNRYYKASTDFESIPIETISGSDGGTFLSGYVTQSWDGINVTPLGDVAFTQTDEEEFYDGEFSGSIITVTDGELNTECDPIKEANTTIIQYDVTDSTYNEQGQDDGPIIQVPLNYFQSTIAPSISAGKLSLWWEASRVVTKNSFTNIDIYKDTFQIKYFAISKTSDNGLDLTNVIPNVTEFIVQTSTFSPSVTSYTGYVSLTTTTSEVVLKPKSIKEYNNSYLIEVEPVGSIILTSQRDLLIPDPVPVPYTVRISTQNNKNVVVEPYIDGNFSISDCNPLINNATEITPSTIYYDVDYANNPNVAVNFGAIMSGSAPKAPIQDFNYYSRRSIIPRYEGSKNGTTTEYSVTNASIDATQALFAYFNWVGGTSPEWGNGLEDRSVANLRFLLDVNGKIIKPIADSKGINQGIVENNFTEGKIATLAFDDEGGSSAAFSNLLGNHTIFKSGKDIVPICYSQTASISSTDTGGYTGSLTFVQGDQQENAAIGDYRLTAFADGTQLLYNDNTDVEFGFLQYSGSLVDLWLNDTTYSTDTPTPTDVSASLEFKAKLVPDQDTGNGRDGWASATFQWYKNGSLVGNSVQVDWNNSNAVFLSYIDNNVIASDTFKLKATTVDYSQGGTPALSTDSFFKVIQTPPPGIGAVGPDATGTDYWQKFGAIGTPGAKRFKTNALTPVYGQKQQDITGSGFFGITNDFILEVGDEIRFQGTETQTYKIIQVDNTTSPPEFTVDRGINLTNPQMDWFLVRRYVDNPANIILEVDKPAGGTSPGILKPQYLSQNAEDNIDTILEQLRRDSLI